MRPLRSLTHPGRAALAFGVGAVVSLAAAVPAGADTTDPTPTSSQSCSVLAPANVVVDSPRASVTFSLNSDCPVGSTAQWDLVAPNGNVVQHIRLNSGQTRSFRPGRHAALGTYLLRPVSASDTAYDQLVQNSPSVTIGARTVTAVKTSRSNRTISVRAAVTTYDRAKRRALPRANAVVRLQRSTCASACPWVPVATAKTDVKGLAQLSARVQRGAYLRVYTDGTATAWGTIGKPFRF